MARWWGHASIKAHPIVCDGLPAAATTKRISSEAVRFILTTILQWDLCCLSWLYWQECVSCVVPLVCLGSHSRGVEIENWLKIAFAFWSSKNQLSPEVWSHWSRIWRIICGRYVVSISRSNHLSWDVVCSWHCVCANLGSLELIEVE